MFSSKSTSKKLFLLSVFLLLIPLVNAGEYTRLDTPSGKIIIGETLNNVRNVITKTNLPILLMDGRVTDDAGISYPYSQEIQLNDNAHVYYSNSDQDLMDPAVHIEMEPFSDKPTYTTRVTFSKSIPIDTAYLIDETIKLFGKEYMIGSGSDYDTLILYGASNTLTMREGEEVKVNIGGTDYTVGVGGVSNTTTAVITVNGVPESINKGTTMKIAGLDVYLADVFYYPKEGQVSHVKVSLGSQKLTLEDDNEVLFGTNDYVNNTLVMINGDAISNEISSFSISTPAQNPYVNDIEIGESYEDPVWKTFILEFSSTTPDLNSNTKDLIVIQSSSDSASIKFTNYEGYVKIIQFAYDNDTSAGTVTPYLMDSNSYKIHIKEGDHIYYKDYIVVNKGDDTHLLQLTNIPAGEIKTTDTIRFTDIFTDTVYEHTFISNEIGSNSCKSGSGAKFTMSIGKEDYYIQVCNATTKIDGYLMVTWDDVTVYPDDTGADYGIPGHITFLPGIKARNGEYIYFVNNYTKFNYGDVVILPGSNMFNTYTIPTSAASIVFEIGEIQYIYDFSTRTITPTALKNYLVGIMILEEKRFDETKHAIYIGIDKTGTLTQTVNVALPTFSDTTNTRDGNGEVGYTTWGSNSNIKSAMDAYGTLVTYDSLIQTEAIISYPVDQLYTDIIIATDETPVETTTTTSTTITIFCHPDGTSIDGLCYLQCKASVNCAGKKPGEANSCCLGCYNTDVTGYKKNPDGTIDRSPDGKVDAKDVTRVVLAFGSKQGPPPSPKWDPLADINKDRKVDAKDVAGIASKFGAKCTTTTVPMLGPSSSTTSQYVSLGLSYMNILIILIASILIVVIVFGVFKFFARRK
jgi:hypothetical protein